MRGPQGLPKQIDLMWPTLQALDRLGGSASLHELTDRVAVDLGLTDAVLDVPHRDGPQTEFAYRAAWARTRLRRIEAVDNPSRGVWTITGKGRRLGSADAVRELDRGRQGSGNRSGPASRADLADGGGDDASADSPANEAWQAALLEILRGMKPDAFERLCQRLLREYGFTRVAVTGRTGDEGIDGTGVLRVNLISFHVNYQCKRYAGTVGPGSIRDFRGALVGRADKGLFITTGRFTAAAEREAVRGGTLAIDLIDGVELCGLLKDKGLGVVRRDRRAGHAGCGLLRCPLRSGARRTWRTNGRRVRVPKIDWTNGR